MHPVQFLRETVAELKLVHWPSRQATIKLTAIVITISVLVGVYVGGLDYVFTNLLKLIVK